MPTEFLICPQCSGTYFVPATSVEVEYNDGKFVGAVLGAPWPANFYCLGCSAVLSGEGEVVEKGREGKL